MCVTAKSFFAPAPNNNNGPSDPSGGSFLILIDGDAGEPSWIRTSDLLIKSQLLYRLSYGPTLGAVTLVEAGGQGGERGDER